MNFDIFISNFYRKYNHNNQGMRIGQFFMNELSVVDLDMCRSIPEALDPFYDDTKLQFAIDWISDRWVDDDDDETELIHRAVRNGADLDSL